MAVFILLSSIAVIPTLQLDLGSNLNPEDIEEGDDVYFECKVHANPAAYKVVWKHNVSSKNSFQIQRFIKTYRLREAQKKGEHMKVRTICKCSSVKFLRNRFSYT